MEKTDACWYWLAGKTSDGYGMFAVFGANNQVHRLAYSLLVGPIPEGLQLDHLCRERNCVNPAHLEPVTIKENVLRGDGPTARNARKTECLRGHPYDQENTEYAGKGRRCKACNRAAAREYQRRKAAERRGELALV